MQLHKPETLQSYVFANGNPYVFRDPTGLFSLPSLMGTVLIRGVLATTAIAIADFGLRQSRGLNEQERDFVSGYFGNSVDLNSINLRGGGSLFNGARSWTPAFGYIQLSNDVFVGGRSDNSVDLSSVNAKATLAHEILHVWQRNNGIGPTGEGIVFQPLHLLGVVDAYGYPELEDQYAMLANFLAGSAEVQGAMFERYVKFAESGDTRATRYKLIANYIRGR